MSKLETMSTDALLAHALEAAENDPSGEDETRWAPIQQLHSRNESSIFDSAVKWCSSEKPWIKCLGADILGQLGCEEEEPPFVGPSEPILTTLLEESNEEVLTSALMALGHLEVGDLETICRHQTHESEDVRYAVAYCMGPRGDDEARAVLISLSADEDLDVRNWATFGLGTLSDVDSEAIREALVARLRDEDSEVRGEALVGLAERGDARAIPATLQELEQDEVSALVVAAAAKLPDPSFVPHLTDLAESYTDDEDIQLALANCQGASSPEASDQEAN
ncbi:MAG: HEAT repeat domain-containing protein [Deltaproteobacteria bacterium]|nr:HEAT repeat domain-containing protein [Deltaproteobacteria bacterium]